MKRSIYYGTLAGLALLCIGFVAMCTVFPDVWQHVLSYPFPLLGMGLRMLSLSGTGGNIAAVLMYIVISLLPVLWLLLCRRRRIFYIEDSLIVLLSVLLFAVLYIMINPGLLSTVWGTNALIPIGKAMLGGIVWSVIAAYAVLKILRRFYGANRSQLQHYFTVFLYISGMVCVCAAFGTELNELYTQFTGLYAKNTGTRDGLLATEILLVVRYLANVLPYVLNVVMLERAIHLFTLLQNEKEDALPVVAAEKLSMLCGKSLAVSVLATVSVNLLQLLCVGLLRDIHGTLSFPFLSIGLILGVLLFARFIAENHQLKADNRQLKEDNDLFI